MVAEAALAEGEGAVVESLGGDGEGAGGGDGA